MTDAPALPSKSLSRSLAKRIGLAVVVAMVAVSTVASLDAHAKRLGGGRTIGRQPQTTQTAPSATNQQSTQSSSMQSTQPSRAQSTQPAAAQPSARSRWLGPIAGLAAGLGIAALLSHFGLGGAFAGMMANVIVIALLAMAGIWIVRKLMSRGRQGATPAYGAAGMPGSARVDMRHYDAPSDAPRMQASEPATFGGASANTGAFGASAGAATAQALPAGFDVDTFLRHAKVNFVRLQAAWDEGNLADIREFTTPEMFAELKVDIDARKDRDQTDVVQLDAALLGVEDRGSEHSASVRFSGLIREAPGASAQPFNEIWTLSKPAKPGEGWVLAGIQQTALH
ncbi:Tim44-like domain-containing protein [Trinickia sp. LjRoot230]|uniref:Tim44 domain-containing protein n=1 Tax=Trinickia sp. LjRoot230 TaxID=3342288 RepID=UPI003ED0B289